MSGWMGNPFSGRAPSRTYGGSQVEVEYYDDMDGEVHHGSFPISQMNPNSQEDSVQEIPNISDSRDLQIPEYPLAQPSDIGDLLNDLFGSSMGSIFGSFSNGSEGHQGMGSGMFGFDSMFSSVLENFNSMLHNGELGEFAENAESSGNSSRFYSSSSSYSSRMEPDGSIVEERVVKYPDGRVERSRSIRNQDEIIEHETTNEQVPWFSSPSQISGRIQDEFSNRALELPSNSTVNNW
eukprot:CAMPEP_0182447598 /NCGR_PEP_ID=MMETSP1172-20130603/17858_1 /TAXON_ID=708627 /ORGANISM="Timspurckia oligopyrenoides, Strain CCMP3278" /LENGTH=236 /DNA_ID=CAMNT_0024644097 /DNA_START=37 /DNA_END=744 /DNA_ORIENTATION=+